MCLIAAGLCGALLVAAPAAAQSYPARSISLVVPFAAGGGVRCERAHSGAEDGRTPRQSIIVENMGGAAGMAGAAHVAKKARRTATPSLSAIRVRRPTVRRFTRSRFTTR